MDKVLIVDDNLINLKYISRQISKKYKVMLAKSGAQALQICSTQRPELILLDVEMPDMDGFEVMERIQGSLKLRSIPVIFLTANHDVEIEVKALASGAVDFVTKPFEQSILLHRIQMHIQYSKYQQNLEHMVKELEDSIVSSFAEIVEYRDLNTGSHVQRTVDYVRILCKGLKEKGYYKNELSDDVIEMIIKSAPMHDIGKIGVPDSVLLKPGKLTADEFNQMKQHTVIGREILQKMYQRTPTQKYLCWAIQIASSHHEKFDGSGYPDGIGGDKIPLCSRIMAVADVYDALVSERVYRKAMSQQEAYNIITESSGTHFDPNIVTVFQEYFQEFVEFHNKNR